jgi:UDP:flavonoid glycosyltransferase YjiC (YdhE family)
VNGASPPRPLRILLSVRPYHGHFHSLVPLARALMDAGHSVAVATAPELASAVLAAGLAWFPAGLHPTTVWELADDDDHEDEDYGPHVLSAKVGDLIDLMVGPFAPDLVIRDPTDLAAVIATEVLGVRCATFGICHFINDLTWHLVDVDGPYNEARRWHGLAPDPALETLYDGLYLSIVPPELDMFDPLPVARVQRIRYQPWDGAEGRAAPPWLQELPARPTVLVTLGTVFNDRLELFRLFLEALATEDVNVVCTVGVDQNPGELGRLPANVRVEQYLPHSLILPFCDAIVCHSGFNTMMGALSAGVPLVAVPLGSDQEHNAERCAELGVGIHLSAEGLRPERVRRAVARVVSEPRFRANLKALRRSMNQLPPLRAAVRRIEAEAARPAPARPAARQT